ncbi:hypothetical protein [Bacteroides sp. 51]|uniref:hypothetical protein n=1 Tax=Bacteroides sp. 51 TaxID=2302938 RepID=UPI0013D8D6B3|nr:hypothetical protein [Bacteroides sp. 51]NDV81052.1 hypothetical protein [Bacteroides sp. 51]
MDNDMLIDQIKEHLFWIKKESGLLLLEIRQRNGLTRLFVAESINMSQRNLSTIERESIKLRLMKYSNSIRFIIPKAMEPLRMMNGLEGL